MNFEPPREVGDSSTLTVICDPSSLDETTE